MDSGSHDQRTEADWPTRVVVSALLTVFLACVAGAEQVGSAWQVALSVREAHDATRDAAAASLDPSVGWSAGLGVLGVLTGGALLVLVRAQARPDRRGARFEIPAGLALLLWAVWLALGPLLGHQRHPPSWPPAFTHWGAAGLAAASIVLLAHAFLADLAAAWERVAVVRLQLVVLAALFAVVVLAPLTSDQMTDVLRAWSDGSAARALAGLAAALLLGAVARTSVVRLLRHVATADAARQAPAAPGAGRWVVVAVAAALALGLFVADAPVGGAVALAIAVVAAFSRSVDPPVFRHDVALRAGPVGGAAALLPLAMLYAGLVAATVQSLLVGDPAWPLSAFAVLAGALFAGGAVLAPSEPRHADHPVAAAACGALALGAVLLFLASPVAGAILLLLGAVTIAVHAASREDVVTFAAGGGAAAGATAVVYADPIGGADALGTLALVLLAATGVLLLLHLAGAVGLRNAPVGDLGGRWFVPGRVPVATLLAAWIALATFMAADDAHRARVLPDAGRGAAPTLPAAVTAWLERAGPHPPPRLPMLLVAASGGGSKAAYWTDLVLDCLLSDEPPRGDECHAPARTADRRRRAIALTSSVSGGSVGVYHYLVHPEAGGADDWLKDSVGREVLSPVTGWAAFHDAPAFLLGLKRDPNRCTTVARCRVHADRALVQEAAVADYRHDIVPPQDAQALAAPRAERPVPIFNGTINGGGGRVLLSPMDLSSLRPGGCPQRPAADRPGAGSVDAYDYLQPTSDLPLATSALLSARFPVIAPPGRLSDGQRSTVKRCLDAPAPLPPIDVRDGGYMENTGLLTITELLPAVRTAIRAWSRKHPGTDVEVMVLSIDDDPIVLSADPELRNPGVAPLSITQRAGSGYLSQLARDRLTSCQYEGVGYWRISPNPHGGARAATGWEVSSTSRRRDLAGALDQEGDAAYRVLDGLRGMLDGTAPVPRCGA